MTAIIHFALSSRRSPNHCAQPTAVWPQVPSSGSPAAAGAKL